MNQPKLPPIKLFCITYNETELLEDFIIYHGELFGYDNIVLVDHLNTNPVILTIFEQYKLKGVTVYRETNPHMSNKGQILTNYMLQYKTQCQFFIIFDTDEFMVILNEEGKILSKEEMYTFFYSLPEDGSKFFYNYFLFGIPDDTASDYDKTQQTHHKPARHIKYFKQVTTDKEFQEIRELPYKKCFFRASKYLSAVNGNHDGEVTDGNSYYCNTFGNFHFHNIGVKREYERSYVHMIRHPFFEETDNMEIQYRKLQATNVYWGRLFEYKTFLLRELICIHFHKRFLCFPSKEVLNAIVGRFVMCDYNVIMQFLHHDIVLMHHTMRPKLYTSNEFHSLILQEDIRSNYTNVVENIHVMDMLNSFSSSIPSVPPSSHPPLPQQPTLPPQQTIRLIVEDIEGTLPPKDTKEMKQKSLVKIFCQTKDEVDMIEDFILYHGYLFGYDNLVIIDHNSTNPKVFEIYETYRQKGVHIEYEPNNEYNLSKTISFFIHKYKDTCIYAIPLDTDEYFCVEGQEYEERIDKASILKQLYNLPNTSSKFYYNYFCVSQSDQNHEQPIHSVIHFERTTHYTKVFFRAEHFCGVDIGFHNGQISQGEVCNASGFIQMHFHQVGCKRFSKYSYLQIVGYGYLDPSLQIEQQYTALKKFIAMHPQSLANHRTKFYIRMLLRQLIVETTIQHHYLPTLEYVNEMERKCQEQNCVLLAEIYHLVSKSFPTLQSTSSPLTIDEFDAIIYYNPPISSNCFVSHVIKNTINSI